MSRMPIADIERRNQRTLKDVNHAWSVKLDPYACNVPGCPGDHTGLFLMAVMAHDEMRMHMVVSDDPYDDEPTTLILTKPQIAELIEDLTGALDVLP